MILTKKKTNTQAKDQNRISYHLLICFLAVNAALRFFQVNSAANVFFMILRGWFINNIVLNLSFQ